MMSENEIEIKETKDIPLSAILELYKANHWSSAEKPAKLYNALINSHSLITVWHYGKLVGLGNSLSDGYLVVLLSSFASPPRVSKAKVSGNSF